MELVRKTLKPYTELEDIPLQEVIEKLQGYIDEFPDWPNLYFARTYEEDDYLCLIGERPKTDTEIALERQTTIKRKQETLRYMEEQLKKLKEDPDVQETLDNNMHGGL